MKSNPAQDAAAFLGVAVPESEVKADIQEPEFTDEQLAAERVANRQGVDSPDLEKLVAHMNRFGPDGILESAVHLPAEEYFELKEKAKQMTFDKKTKKWVS